MVLLRSRQALSIRHGLRHQPYRRKDSPRLQKQLCECKPEYRPKLSRHRSRSRTSSIYTCGGSHRPISSKWEPCGSYCAADSGHQRGHDLLQELADSGMGRGWTRRASGSRHDVIDFVVSSFFLWVFGLEDFFSCNGNQPIASRDWHGKVN